MQATEPIPRKGCSVAPPERCKGRTINSSRTHPQSRYPWRKDKDNNAPIDRRKRNSHSKKEGIGRQQEGRRQGGRGIKKRRKDEERKRQETGSQERWRRGQRGRIIESSDKQEKNVSKRRESYSVRQRIDSLFFAGVLFPIHRTNRKQSNFLLLIMSENGEISDQEEQ